MADRDVLSTQSEILYPEDSIFQGIIGASCQGEIWCSKSPDTAVGTWIYKQGFDARFAIYLYTLRDGR